MADPRFFKRQGPFSLHDIAAWTGARIERGTSDTFDDVAPLETAGAGHLSFFDNIKYLEAFGVSKAGACFVREKFTDKAPKGMALLLTDDPYTAYAVAAAKFYPVKFTPFISPKAHIGEGVEIGAGCRIEAGAWIGDGVVIGEESYIGANAVISHAIIGRRVLIHPGVCIGQDGFGFAPSKTGIIKVPQLGRVLIGDDVEIGANSCIDRGSGPDTIIEQGTKIDNQVQIGHNCHIGRYVIVVAQVGLGGSSRVEDFVMLGGKAGVSGHVTIGKGAKVAARAGVIRDLPAGGSYGGMPAIPMKEFHRQNVALMKLAKRKGGQDE